MTTDYALLSVVVTTKRKPSPEGFLLAKDLTELSDVDVPSQTDGALVDGVFRGRFAVQTKHSQDASSSCAALSSLHIRSVGFAFVKPTVFAAQKPSSDTIRQSALPAEFDLLRKANGFAESVYEVAP